MASILRRLGSARSAGRPRGIYSVCSAHPLVLEAAVRQAVEDGSALLVEATSNQVNQDGGYTGMVPAAFRDFVRGIAKEHGLKLDALILGGDHLGPNAWQDLAAEEAMQRAEVLMLEYARAGFTKLHLDASMSCADDPTPLPDAVVAERAARLCAAAEASGCGQELLYVIGTEVPVPGGATESLQGLAVTSLEDARQTVRVHRETFARHGLSTVWPRILALVVQPGVEFNHDSVIDYDSSKTLRLRSLLEEEPQLVFEAHSTDYQRPDAYRELVRDGFAILKVGPALTYAMREALFALAAMEDELVTEVERSQLVATVEEAMLEHPQHWAKHYHGSELALHILRIFSYSDRIRYYWPDPKVQAATSVLFRNLNGRVLPETMVSNFLPEQYRAMRGGRISCVAHEMVIDRIREALKPYAEACGCLQKVSTD